MGRPIEVDLRYLPDRSDMGDGFAYGSFANDLLEDVIPEWQRAGFIQDPGNGSWGGIVVNPAYAGHYCDAPRDDPAQFIGTVFGDGHERPGYALNAARKCLLLAEYSVQFTSSLAITRRRGLDLGESAKSAVSSRDRRWMRFAHGGAVLVGEGASQRMWGISAFDEKEDHALALLLGELAGMTRSRGVRG
jgi:hypothetical protein